MVWLWVAVLTALTVVASLPTAYVGADGSSVNQNMVSNLVAQVGVELKLMGAYSNTTINEVQSNLQLLIQQPVFQSDLELYGSQSLTASAGITNDTLGVYLQFAYYSNCSSNVVQFNLLNLSQPPQYTHVGLAPLEAYLGDGCSKSNQSGVSPLSVGGNSWTGNQYYAAQSRPTITEVITDLNYPFIKNASDNQVAAWTGVTNYEGANPSIPCFETAYLPQAGWVVPADGLSPLPVYELYYTNGCGTSGGPPTVPSQSDFSAISGDSVEYEVYEYSGSWYFVFYNINTTQIHTFTISGYSFNPYYNPLIFEITSFSAVPTFTNQYWYHAFMFNSNGSYNVTESYEEGYYFSSQATCNSNPLFDWGYSLSTMGGVKGYQYLISYTTCG
jgi:hypothetical protein